MSTRLGIARVRSGQCRLPGILVLGLAALLLGSCIEFPTPEPDDEGHATFAREVIPVLLGRAPRGVDEVEVVADIAQLHGRNVAVEMLMKDQEFIDHWTDVMVEILKVQRHFRGGVLATQDEECWGPPTRSAPDTAIADWVRNNTPSAGGAPTPAWNMTDLVQSALAADDMSVVFQANLFPMAHRLGGASSRRNELTDHFVRTYLNRDIVCLRCHNPTYSTSNKTNASGDIVWRRLWAPNGHPEKALFGNYSDTNAAIGQVRPIFRGDVRKPVPGTFGIRPWGIAESCATDTNSRVANNGTAVYEGFRTLGGGDTAYTGAKFGSLDGGANPQVSLWELESSLRQGIADLQDGYRRFTPPPTADQLVCGIVEVFSNCVGCHGGASPAAGMNLASDPVGNTVNIDTQAPSSVETKRVVPNNTGDSELFRRITTTDMSVRMPPYGNALTSSEIQKIEDWINGGAPSGDPSNCSVSDVPDVEPDEAFAYLVASSLVNGIWENVMGYRLTIDHGYSRNKQQRDALWNLTEYTLLTNDWSLKAVLVKILASDWMGRRAPTISQSDSAYELPLTLDPWFERDPSVVTNPDPHEIANGQGDMVNRHRVNTILRKIGTSLAWEEPRRFTGGGYPSPLDEQLGQYFSPGTPGFNGINFQSLLALESTAGLCNKSGKAVGSDDWIDQLVNDVGDFNTANPVAPITLAELWAIIKDRLIQDTTIETTLPVDLAGDPNAKTEQDALAAFFDQGTAASVTLNSSTSDLSVSELESKVREACGVVVKTPEFLLTNITPRGYSDNQIPDPPRLPVCMEGESCGYAGHCAKWAGVLRSMGQYTACEDRSVRHTTLRLFPLPDHIFDLITGRVHQLCPGRLCAFVQRRPLNPCIIDPQQCEIEMMTPVPMDPDDEMMGRFPADLHQPHLIIMNAEGARVSAAEGVLIRQSGRSRWRSLKSGSTLDAGDMLHVPLMATLKLDNGDLKFGVDGLKEKEIEGVSAHLISITGPSATKMLDRQLREEGAIPFSTLVKATEAGIYESRAPTKEDWRRIISFGPKPGRKQSLTPEEIEKLNADFDALHFPPAMMLDEDEVRDLNPKDDYRQRPGK